MLSIKSLSSRRLLWLAGCALVVLLVATPFVANAFVVPAASMESTILVGDHLILGRAHRSLAFGDLIAFRSPTDPRVTFLKRIAGVPGDRIHFENKVLYRNGSAVQEPYTQRITDFVDQFRDNFPAEPGFPLPDSARKMLAEHRSGRDVVVPPGHYFVLGDNRDNSLDSRYFGFVPEESVRGMPLFVYWSRDPQGGTRWDRTFQRVR
ncbi:MAG: signal peptidase I [Paludibaculum sp.]